MTIRRVKFVAPVEDRVVPEGERLLSMSSAPYVAKLIYVDLAGGVMRFDGHFHGLTREELPGHAYMFVEHELATVQQMYHVRIVSAVVGPCTNVYGGRTSDEMSVARTLAAAAASAPFQPIPPPDEPSAEELACRASEAEAAARRCTMAGSMSRETDDDMDGYVCFTGSNVIDLRFEFAGARS
jgi:hypothetical protein